MIKSLKIQNIQSHVNTKLDFCDGVNMIIGDSDTGKSAILNSMFWCMFNRPLGDPHRNWNGGEMISCVELDNGIVQISRDKQTKYKIIQPGQNKDKVKSFKASGTTPPEEVQNLFNMDRKINVQKQLERDAPIFLISESPGEVALFLNKVAGLYKIDESVGKGKSDLRKTQSDLNTTKDLIKEKQEELEKYEGIDEIHAKVLVCNETTLKQAENTLILGKLQSLETDIQEIEHKTNKLKQKVQIKHKVKQALSLVDNVLLNVDTVGGILETIKGINFREQKQNKLKVRTDIKDKVQKGFDLLNTKEEVTKKCEFLWDKIDQIQKQERTKSTLLIKKERLKKNFHELMPEQCPLCGGLI